MLDAGLAHHGHAFFAHEQLNGKGQRGKGWVSEPGLNILLSVVIDPSPTGRFPAIPTQRVTDIGSS